MRILVLAATLLTLQFAVGCDKKLKEHPLPASMKKKIQQENDPAIKEKEVAGTIRIDDALAGDAPKNASLFIIARKPGQDSGPPLAVRRHSLAKLPFEYSIGQMNVMLEGNHFEGTIQLTARLDQDGNAKASPGDLEGSLVVQAGNKKADIVLDKIIAGTNKTITGTVVLDPAVQNKLPQNGSLFIIARSEGVERGFPLAVKLEKQVQFPYQFTLGPRDVMMPGGEFDGSLTLIARLDADGDAKPGPNDVQGMVVAQAGDKGVIIKLDKLYQAPAGK